MRLAWLAAGMMVLTGCTTLSSEWTQPMEDIAALVGIAQDPSPTAIHTTHTGGMLLTGSAQAPLTLSVYTNFDCAYCGKFHALTMQIAQPWLEQGYLRISTIPVALNKYEDSDTDAATAVCALANGGDTAVFSVLFSTDANTKARREALEQAGVDVSAIEPCMAEDSTQMLLRSFARQASEAKATLLPRYALNGKVFTGLPEAADLRGQIRTAFEQLSDENLR